MEKSTKKLEEITNFGEKLNQNLKFAVLKLDDRAIVAEDKEQPIVDLYQIGDKWVKFKSKKTGKTWLVDVDQFASLAAKNLAKPLSDDEKSKVKAGLERIASKNGDFAGKITVSVCVQPIDDGFDDDQNQIARSLNDLWKCLETTKWESATKYQITDQFMSKDVYQSLTRPFKQNGELCNPTEFIVLSSPFKSCWYTNGRYVPGSSDQVWHRAIDPIAWFGKQIEEKPTNLESYDNKEVALTPPTKELEEATLREDEAFGYAV